MLHSCSEVKNSHYSNLKHSKIFICYNFNAVLHHIGKSMIFNDLSLGAVYVCTAVFVYAVCRDKYNYHFRKERKEGGGI